MKIYQLLMLLLCSGGLFAQTSYQRPPQTIADLVDAPLAPRVTMDDAAEWMILMERSSYKSIAELSERELRLGGLRINPKTNIGSRTTYYNGLSVKKARETDARPVRGLPAAPRLANISWSPDQTRAAFTHTTAEGVELWVLDVAKASARRLVPARVNANLRGAFTWARDGKSLLVKVLPEDRQPLIDPENTVPSGPTVSTSTAGQKAQNRTYQDLLKNPNDEQNFSTLATSELYRVTLDGSLERWAPAAMYTSLSYSPDGEYLLVSYLERPFSYLVPYYRFPTKTDLYRPDGRRVKNLLDVPLVEVLPKGFMSVRTGKRGLRWRADHPATLVWTEALDGGDPANEVAFRDEVFQQIDPVDGTPQSLVKLQQRFGGITWGNAETALVEDYWWDTRNTKTYVFNPNRPEQPPTVLVDRNYQDQFSDPGSFVTKRNKFGRNVLALDGDAAFLIGDGWTEEGQFPFVSKQNLKTGQTERLYTSRMEGQQETILDAIDVEEGTYLVMLESPTAYPNYYLRNLKKRIAPVPLTHFENPFEAISKVHKEVITYEREDGLELSGTLYLPAGYDRNSGEKLPMILWAYPREYKDRSSAAQNTTNPNEFIYPYYGSPIYWVTQGYAVLDNAAFPIIGEGEEEPNDSFRKQLVANGSAAIDAVDALGYIDRNRVGVGGHSYGAFMVANLLSHSDLFAAGIARSGAYNRTLTPFGFQSEQRSYWEAPEVYNAMSPFMHADKMKTPLLLVHGEADNNSGTYPLQSERYFNALKGHGAPARLVMLPKESHGYRAKESILHMLWEQHQWLEKYVKHREVAP